MLENIPPSVFAVVLWLRFRGDVAGGDLVRSILRFCADNVVVAMVVVVGWISVNAETHVKLSSSSSSSDELLKQISFGIP